ncbi:sensor domain-containing diguanylate cyclase [Aliikangiella coralliicola]|uniref:diguanylate cyclase n=1 Tax=Aliikangiella coralliicola TaxID=2592383 RepID=A0A545UK72_9GAMM|nr:sensor domain-containing diguanylate cyclase [Aliikangiella coralliicola]
MQKNDQNDNHFNHYSPDKWLLDNPHDLISLKKWQRTVNLLAKLFDAPAGFLVQYTPDGFQVTIASEQEENPYSAGAIIEPDANIFCRRIVETEQSLYVRNAPVEPCWDTNPEVHNDGFVSYLGVPVFWPNSQPFGTFCVMDYRETDYDETYFELINQLKDILESDLHLLEMYEQVQKLATTDPLTEINNRRGFTALTKQRIRLARRMKTSLGLFYLDIDQFKVINDEHGHVTGDKVLKVVADALRNSIRNSDVIGRIGGDEFLALVTISNEGDEEKILQRFTQSLSQLQDTARLPGFTVSAGYAAVDIEMSIEDIIEIADRAMLAKKKR